MTKFRSLQTSLFALFSLVIVNVEAVYAASPVEDAVAGWMQSLKDLGVSVAKFGSIRIDDAADTATIENIQIQWGYSYPDAKFSVDVNISLPEVVLQGFKEEANGYSIKRYTISDDNKSVVSGTDDKGIAFRTDFTMAGASASGLYYPKFASIPEDPKHPVSRYLHLYDLFKKVVTEKTVINKVAVTSSVDGKPSSSIEYEGMITRGMANGRVEEMRINSFKQTVVLPPEAGMPFDKVVTTYGSMVQKGLDFGPILAAIKGGASSAYADIVEEATITDVNVVAGPVNISVDSYTIKGMKARSGKSSLLEMADRKMLGEKIDEKEIIATVLKFASNFALDEWSINNVSGTGPGNINGKLDKFIIAGLSGDGMKEFSLVGLDGNGPGGEKISLGNVTVANVLFPPLEAIMAAAENGPPQDPIKMAELAPKVGKFEISKLLADIKIQPAVSVGLFRVLQSAYIGPIPTDIRINAEDFKVPVSYIQDPAAQAMLRTLGYDVLGIAAKVVLKWHESTQDLILQNADVSLEGGANIHLEAGLAGVPREVIQNPKRFMSALTTLAFKNVNLLVTDGKIVPSLIGHFAKLQNMPPEALQTMIVSVLESQAGPLAGTPFVADVKAALTAFLANPKRLAIDIAPKNPVPFTQILGTAGTAPDQIPELLGATASAN